MTVRRLLSFPANHRAAVINASSRSSLLSGTQRMLFHIMWHCGNLNVFTYVSEPAFILILPLCASRWLWVWTSGSTCLVERSHSAPLRSTSTKALKSNISLQMNDHVFCHFYRTYRTSCDRRRVPLYRLPLPIAVTFCIFHVLIPWKTLKTPQMHQPITTPVSHSLTNGKMWKCPFPVLSVLYKCKMSII